MNKEKEMELKMDEKDLADVNGGGIVDSMANKLRTAGYLYKPGDKVTDIWAPQNGIGVVTKNVGVSRNYYIDEVYFPEVNQTYNSYESNLYPA